MIFISFDVHFFVSCVYLSVFILFVLVGN